MFGLKYNDIETLVIKMRNNKKLKRDTSMGKKIFIGLLFFCAIILIRLFYGVNVTFLVGALLMMFSALWSFILTVKTKNWYFIVGFLMFLFLVTANLVRVFYSESIGEYFLFGVLIFGLWWIYINITKKVKPRVREILELAAKPVNGISNGFTPRPYVSGNTVFLSSEMKAFSGFLSKHLIALPYHEKNRTIHLLEYSYKHVLYLRNDWSGLTHIIFNDNGDVLVNISRKYYEKYKEELTFDQLCSSLGNLFVEFLELHKKGAGYRIIDRMNAT